MDLSGLEHRHGYAVTSARASDGARDHVADTLVGGASSDPDRVHGRLGVGATVGDHHLTGNTEQQRATGLAVVDPIAQVGATGA